MESCTALKKQKIDESSGDNNIRAWADLSEDILVSIFEKLDLKNRLKGSPLCCTSWYTASKHPSLWSNIHLPNFFHHSGGVVTTCSPRQLVEFIVRRSQGLLTSITFLPNNSVRDLLFVAQRCPKLKYFHLTLGDLHRLISWLAVDGGKKIICTAISKLKELESVEVDEEFISKEILETIAQNCPNFHKLCFVDSTISSEAASLIIKFLPNLKTLDIKSADIHRNDLLVIFNGCLKLEDVDISGCGKIWSGDEILKIGQRRFKKFEWEKEVKALCTQCEESPCEHSFEDGLYDYIHGTRKMIMELNSDLFDDDDDDDDEDEI